MKVAVYHNLPTGGAKRALFEMISRSNQEHEYHLFTPYESNEQFLDLRPYVKTVRTYAKTQPPATTRLQKLANLIYCHDVNQIGKLQRKIANDINASGCDVVLVTNCAVTQSPAILSYLTLPTVFYTQEALRSEYEYLLKQRYLSGNRLFLPFKKARLARIKAIDAQAIHATDKVLCNSYFSGESLTRAYGIMPEVCYLGVGSEFKVAKPPKRQNAIAVVGALEPFKNQAFVVEAVAQIETDRPSVELVFDREHAFYREQVMQLAKAKGVTVNLHKGVSDEVLRSIYASSTATVCVALLEPFGFTPLESMMAGTPAIALRLGGYRETVVDGKNGYLINHNTAELASAIMRLQSSTPAGMRPEKLITYAEDWWSWESTIQHLNQLLSQALTKS